MRDQPVTVLLRQDEKVQLKAEAGAAGVAMGEVLRRAWVGD